MLTVIDLVFKLICRNVIYQFIIQEKKMLFKSHYLLMFKQVINLEL